MYINCKYLHVMYIYIVDHLGGLSVRPGTVNFKHPVHKT